MAAQEPAREALTERPPEAPAAATAIRAPMGGLLSAAGNRAIARAVSTGTPVHELVAPGGRRAIARAPAVTPAPAARIARDDRELTENDKQRLRTMVVARLRGAVPRLTDPKKADLPRIARHLKPVEAILNGFAAGGAAGGTLSAAADEVRMVALALESAGGSMKAAIGRAVTRWQAAGRQLGAARSAIAGELAALSRRKPGEPEPEGVDREQMIQDISHLTALQQQIGNAVRDLAEAPRNEEALKGVLDTHVSLTDEMAALENLYPAAADTRIDAALQAFTDGVAALAPFALALSWSASAADEDALRKMRAAAKS